MQIHFRVDGAPIAQPRVKATVRGKHAAVYDPGTANGWKAKVALESRSQRPAEPLLGEILVSMKLYLPRPKRLCRVKDPDCALHHIAKPDCDNLAKAILDALTDDGWWRDDSQVCCLHVWKFYHAKGGRPGAEITVATLED